MNQLSKRKFFEFFTIWDRLDFIYAIKVLDNNINNFTAIICLKNNR